ncbi:extracellular matrix regulator RemB [Desulfoscipio sp. XC116]|uniref:extracellular matrix regulator RemB n=1 Tax=Desulfoscipio sp. XC116 TaxID=3144975 RepID=UPI00325B17C5
MFLHLGGDVIVPKKDIVAILDIRSQSSAITREFLDIAEDEGFIVNISEPGKEKTYIITGNEIYLSPISCTTLKKRAL